MANRDKELRQILDVLFDEPNTSPDMNIISHIAVGSGEPIRLLQDTVKMLWLALERPERFDEAVRELR